jgi:hypothetical protein
MKKIIFSVATTILYFLSFSQYNLKQNVFIDERDVANSANQIKIQFTSTSVLLDAAINSLNSLNSLIKKENYRNKITSFNNPTSSDMGFNLEIEIQTAIKPILAKAKNTNTNKFSEVISALINNPTKMHLQKTSFGTGTVFNTVLSLVGSLAVHEKHVSRQDLDSFMYTMSKYFIQYEKLHQANQAFDQNIDKLNLRLHELQFDIREYMLDLITILNKNVQRSQLKQRSLEELLLKYLDNTVLDTLLTQEKIDAIYDNSIIRYPGDGIKTAKEITHNIQKLFNEYQKIYAANYNEIKTILQSSKTLGKTINIKQVDASVKELDELYKESKDADILNLRLNTLTERLKHLVSTEQLAKKQT